MCRVFEMFLSNSNLLKTSK